MTLYYGYTGLDAMKWERAFVKKETYLEYECSHLPNPASTKFCIECGADAPGRAKVRYLSVDKKNCRIMEAEEHVVWKMQYEKNIFITRINTEIEITCKMELLYETGRGDPVFVYQSPCVTDLDKMKRLAVQIGLDPEQLQLMTQYER